MSLRYPQPTYALYGTPQWPDDIKPEYDDNDEPGIVDDKGLDSSNSVDMTVVHDTQRHSMVKLEDNFPTATHMWPDRPHGLMSQMRHYSQPNIPMVNTAVHSLGRVNDMAYGYNHGPPSAWPYSAHSESTTPTPIYNTVSDGYAQPTQYPASSASYAHYQTADPSSAVSMSPQSSQGGWASNTSSDNTEPRPDVRSPRFRAMSPMTVLRSDGIRKKNARFEIPKERNLANIDALIMQSTDETEKKELKQQKRLLRNRQAALDSRQRKKTHTEKLEQEKKMFSSQKSEMEEAITHLESTLSHEREQWMQQRQQYESYIQNLQYERDEAIRTKTLETAELRRMNNVLKDCVRDLERQQNSRNFSASNIENFNGDFNSFGNLDIEDNWEDEFSLISGEDLKMDGEDSPRREVTPRPQTTPESKLLASKQDSGFSWNTFYMCLLFGAFIASNSKSNDVNKSSSTSQSLSSNIPALSDDYRVEAGNVLKAVLASAPHSTHEMSPSRPSTFNHNPTNGYAGSNITRQAHQSVSNSATSSLEALHTSLTTPTRNQQAAATFSLSVASYNHITNPNGVLDDDDDDPIEVKGPTRLQQLYANMQAERDGIDKMNGMSGKARERSVLLDRVPEKVLRDFKELVGLSEATQMRQEHHQENTI